MARTKIAPGVRLSVGLQPRNRRHRPATRRPLMLGAARNLDGSGPGETSDQAADSGASVPGGADVGIVQHGVTKSAHATVGRRFRLGENIDQTVRVRIGDLVETEPDAFQRRDYRSRI